MAKTLSAAVSAIEKIGDDKVIVFLDAPGFEYKAGQYAELTFGDTTLPRPYSIANAPKQGTVEIHIRDSGKGGASTYAVTQLAVGDTVSVKGPYGSCHWNSDMDKPLLLIAGGIGIAPLKAIAEAALSETQNPVHLYWGVRHSGELYLEETLKTLAQRHPQLQYKMIVDDPVGPIAVDDTPNAKEMEIFLAGPPQMIAQTIEKLLKKGVARSAIHTDDPAHHHIHKAAAVQKTHKE